MNAPYKPDLSGFPELPDLAARPVFFGTGRVYPPAGKTQEERDAAWARFLDGAKAGYESDGTKLTRDEMNERW